MIDPLNLSMEDADEAQQQNGYAEYWQSIDATLHFNMETPDSFLDMVPLATPEEREFMQELASLGQEDRDAPVNNRYERLEFLSRERSRLQVLVTAYDVGEEPEFFDTNEVVMDGKVLADTVGEDLKAMMPPCVTGDEDRTRQTARVEELAKEILAMQESIRRDKTMGVFVDYGQLKKLYRLNDRGRQYNGSKQAKESFFTKKAMGIGCVKMAARRPGNSQAHHAKMMENINFGDAQSMRQLQGRGRRRKDYNEEE